MSELNIPENWVETRLENLVEILDSKRKPIKAKDRVDGPYPYYGANGIQGYHNEFIFNERLLLLAEDGGHFGSVSKDIAYIVDGKYWVNNHAHVLKNVEGISLDYLFQYLRRFNVKPWVTGTTVPKLNQSKTKELPIALPPYQEQERIASKVNLAFCKVEEVEKALKKILVVFEKMSISYLLNDGNWLPSVPLEELTCERTCRIGIKNPENRKIGVDNKLGVVDLRVTSKNTFEKYKIVKKGDILYNPMRVNVGSIALYLDDDDAITSPDYIVFSTREGYSPWLIFNFLKSAFGAEEISKKLTGSVRERLYYKKLKDIPFPNPTLSNHKRAEKILNGINSEIELFESKLALLLNLTEQSVLQKAFQGQLVPQIKSEGTGHELLDSIMDRKKDIKK